MKLFYMLNLVFVELYDGCWISYGIMGGEG